MEISRTSWHYKAIKSLNRQPRNNLCPYMRQVVYAVACIIGIGLALLATGTAILAVATYPIWQIFLREPVAAVFCVIGYMVLFGNLWASYRADWKFETLYHQQVPVWGPAWLHYDLFAWTKNILPERKPREYKPPGLIYSFLKAKHDKVCPVLEFKDGH